MKKFVPSRDKQAFTVRLAPDLYLALLDRARAQGRSIGAQVEKEMQRAMKRSAA